jgi:phosphotransferase system enzyme I (PtsI)
MIKLKRREQPMITLTGKSVFHDVCIGKLIFHKKQEKIIKRTHIEDTEAECKSFIEAKEQAIKELQDLYQKALIEVGEANAAIFDVHQMLLDDEDYGDSINNIIRTEKVNAEYAVAVTSDNFAGMFEAMEDAYMQGRATDIRDISDRVIRILCKEAESNSYLKEPMIIAADDLVPSETIKLDKSMVLGFAMKQGSVNSHTAILARSMGIPALVSIGETLRKEYEGKLAIIDGITGTMFIDPDVVTLQASEKKRQEVLERKTLLLALKGKENITKDGRKINIFANIGNSNDVAKVLENDAEGIGLFRSEFIYLENDTYPTEEQQFSAYKTVAQNMAGKKVIIRTLDIGADKQAAYFNLDNEENPAMGYRAIRICLTRTEIFKTQLRSLLRAALFGNISIMFPMIISINEVIKIKEIMKEVKQELTQEGIPFKENIEIGIMIETPAAVMISEELAQEVDFFSVGTNDLTQYTLAIDRQNQNLDAFYDAHHPAVLKMIQMATESAHKAGKWIGICGELGADVTLIETFIKMGIDEISVSPNMVLELRKAVRELDLS